MFPPSVEDWLDQKHLARFIVDVVSKLDLHELKMAYMSGVNYFSLRRQLEFPARANLMATGIRARAAAGDN